MHLIVATKLLVTHTHLHKHTHTVSHTLPHTCPLRYTHSLAFAYFARWLWGIFISFSFIKVLCTFAKSKSTRAAPATVATLSLSLSFWTVATLAANPVNPFCRPATEWKALFNFSCNYLKTFALHINLQRGVLQRLSEDINMSRTKIQKFWYV